MSKLGILPVSIHNYLSLNELEMTYLVYHTEQKWPTFYTTLSWKWPTFYTTLNRDDNQSHKSAPDNAHLDPAPPPSTLSYWWSGNFRYNIIFSNGKSRWKRNTATGYLLLFETNVTSWALKEIIHCSIISISLTGSIVIQMIIICRLPAIQVPKWICNCVTFDHYGYGKIGKVCSDFKMVVYISLVFFSWYS